MTKVQKFVPIAVLLVILLALGYLMLPFRIAGVIDCGAPLLGSNPKAGQEPVGFIVPDRDCERQGRSRLVTAAVITLIFVVGGAAAVFLKPQSRQCLKGDHGDCPDGWANIMGQGAGFGCQCECHA